MRDTITRYNAGTDIGLRDGIEGKLWVLTLASNHGKKWYEEARARSAVVVRSWVRFPHEREQWDMSKQPTRDAFFLILTTPSYSAQLIRGGYFENGLWVPDIFYLPEDGDEMSEFDLWVTDRWVTFRFSWNQEVKNYRFEPSWDQKEEGMRRSRKLP